MVAGSEGSGFAGVMLRELLGAAAVGIIVTALCYLIFSRTSDVYRQVFCSIFAVSLAYYICEKMDFSGAIASVVCGILFSSLIARDEERGKGRDLGKFNDFWEMLDTLLNSLLYVMLGLSFVRILQMEHVLILSLIAVVCNLLGRGLSVGTSSLLISEIPDGFSRWSFTKLLTWGGLRGGLCIALATSTAAMLDYNTFHIILGTAYAVVFFTTVIQGLTMKRFYERCVK